MSDVIIYGIPPSSYTRTARMACAEKGVSYDFEPVQLGSEALKALHPYARVPVLKHGDLVLYETSAIIHYIDEAFEGPSLQPAEPAARAIMEQYISVLNAYVNGRAIRGYAFHYIFAGESGPDRAAIDAGLPGLARELDVLDAAYKKSAWIAGDALSLADLLIMPVVDTVASFPEGAELVGARSSLGRALDAMKQRDSYRSALPSS
jgi:glutathione S-transferase